MSTPVTQRELREAVREFYFFHTGTAGSFSQHLFEAILRADTRHTERLAMGFPAEVQAVRLWRLSSTEREFWQEFGVGPYFKIEREQRDGNN